MDICEVKRCKQTASMVYAASKSGRRRNICTRHWELHCDKQINLKAHKTFKAGK